MLVFLTGATGFLGSAIATRLLAQGYGVLALIRSVEAAAELEVKGISPLLGGLDSQKCLRIGAMSADAVIHTAFNHDFTRFAESCALDRGATASLGLFLAGTSKKLIVTAGLPLVAGRVVSEEAAAPDEIQSLRVSEQVALKYAAGVDVSVIRMPQMHNHSRQGFATHLAALAAKTGFSGYVREGINRWPAVHLDDVAGLYVRALENGRRGAIYHAVDEQGICVRDVADAIGRREDTPVKSLQPDESAEHFGWLDRMVQMDMPASSRRTQELLQWKPRRPSGFLESVAQMSH